MSGPLSPKAAGVGGPPAHPDPWRGTTATLPRSVAAESRKFLYAVRPRVVSKL